MNAADGTRTPLLSLTNNRWNVRTDPTICSFKQIPIPPCAPNKHVVMVSGYCRLHYFDHEDCNIGTCSVPPDIQQLITNFVYKHKSSKYYADDITEKLLPTFDPIKIVHKAQLKRLHKEYSRFDTRLPSGIGVSVHPENYRYLLFAISGPINTAYEGGIFYLEMFITKYYPFAPPKCRFLTPIIHPYIDQFGCIYLTMFKDMWKHSIIIRHILVAIQRLLGDRKMVEFGRGCDPYPINENNQCELDEKDWYKFAKKATQKFAIIPKDLMY